MHPAHRWSRTHIEFLVYQILIGLQSHVRSGNLRPTIGEGRSGAERSGTLSAPDIRVPGKGDPRAGGTEPWLPSASEPAGPESSVPRRAIPTTNYRGSDSRGDLGGR